MKGFSLIELMVVIAIIFILVSTVYPQIQGHLFDSCNTLECTADKQDDRLE